ncbi:MAG: response regulator [Candidatus Micrarchaeota archaeon]
MFKKKSTHSPHPQSGGDVNGKAPKKSGILLAGEPSKEQKPLRIMAVDDELLMLRALRRSLAKHGFEVEAFSSGADAIRAYPEGAFDLVISGLEIMAALREIDPDSRIILLSGSVDSVDQLLTLTERGADLVLNKPVTEEQLRFGIAQVLGQQDVLEELLSNPCTGGNGSS